MTSRWCGLISYKDGLEEQAKSYDHCLLTGESTLLGLEHMSVITLGKRIHDTNSEIRFCPEGVEVCFTDRGGEATLHSPGQLVVYPVLNIRKINLNVRDYVCLLERSAVSALKTFGIQTFIINGQPGVFTERGKIAFLGIRVRNGVTQHGMSINVCNDLSLFQHIRACGKDSQSLDSMQMHDINATPKHVFTIFSEHFHAHLTKTTVLKECSLRN